MKRFSELGIQQVDDRKMFNCPQVSILDIINCEVEIVDFIPNMKTPHGEARYNSEQISSLYWNWVESGNAADKAKWIEAKDAIRKELPYPNEEGGGE